MMIKSCKVTSIFVCQTVMVISGPLLTSDIFLFAYFYCKDYFLTPFQISCLVILVPINIMTL